MGFRWIEWTGAYRAVSRYVPALSTNLISVMISLVLGWCIRGLLRASDLNTYSETWTVRFSRRFSHESERRLAEVCITYLHAQSGFTLH